MVTGANPSRSRPIVSVPAMQPVAIEFLFIMCAGNAQLFTDAQRLLEPQHFDGPQETPLRITWEAMRRSFATTRAFSFEALDHYAREYLAENPTELHLLSEEAFHILFRNDNQGLLYAIAYPDIPISEPNLLLARSHMQRLANERTVVNHLRRILDPNKPGVPEIGDALRVVSERADSIKVLNQIPIVDMTPAFGSPVKPAAEYTPTGMSVIDSRFGGQRVGDVNGILGSTGSGKTTFLLHLAVCCARQSWLESQTTGKPVAPVLFFSAEESAEKLRPRLWSNWYSIPRGSLEGQCNWESFSTAGNLRPYELEMQAGQPRQLSEYERYVMGSEELKQTFYMLDISGSENYPEAGKGYIPEIGSYVDRITQQCGVAPKAIFIDYAGLLVERWMDMSNMAADKAYQYGLKRFGDKCRLEITERYRTTMWVLQQLKGDSADYSPTKELTHADTGACKDFATNLAMCGILGNPDKNTGCRVMHFPKTRYKPDGATVPKAILKIHPLFSRMVDVTSQYSIDIGTRQILPVSESRAIGGMQLVSGALRDAGV